MGILIDCIIIGSMIGFIYWGYKRGLIKVAISFVAFIISILLAVILYRPISNQIINNTELDEQISAKIYNSIENIDFQNITEQDKENNSILAIAENYIDEAIEKTEEDTASYVAQSLTVTIIEGLTFIAILIILRIILLLLNLIADFIGNMPIIKQFNKSGGIIYGVIEGVLVINIIFAILYMLNPIVGSGKIQKTIEKSYIGELIYKNNLIIKTIEK